MELRRVSCSLLALTLVAAGVGRTNEFVTASRSDWLRNTSNGQEVRAQITLESDGWRQWSEFGGLGVRWVYTDATSDWVWIWDGQNAQPFANLTGSVGSYRTVDLGGAQRGRVRVAARSQQLTTPAGAFADVTQLTLQTTSTTSGVTSIWFARGVGIVKYVKQSSAGNREFILGSAYVGGRSHPATTCADEDVDHEDLPLPDWAHVAARQRRGRLEHDLCGHPVQLRRIIVALLLPRAPVFANPWADRPARGLRT